MTSRRNLWFGLLALLAAMMAASTPAAAQLTAQQSAARDAAIHRCIAATHRLYSGPSQGMERSDFSKASITSAGFAP